MSQRRRFLQSGLVCAAAPALAADVVTAGTSDTVVRKAAVRRRLVSTQDIGMGANQTARRALQAGARLAEGTPCNTTVGRCHASAAIDEIAHPVTVARAVREKTTHVMLVGVGTQQFAVEQGFERCSLASPEGRAAWQEWRAGRGAIARRSMRSAQRVCEPYATVRLVTSDSSGLPLQA